MANQVRINFLPCEPSPAEGYLVKYRPVGSVEALRTWPDNFADTPAVFVTDEDPDGTQYEGFIYGDCGDGNLGVAIPWSTADESSGSDACIPVEFTEGSVPDATDGEPYVVDLHLTGTSPFALESVTKPAWMSVTLVGATVQLRGTPPAAAADQELTIVASNCGAADTDTFTDTFDVVEAAPGLGGVSVEGCASEATITDVSWNGVSVTHESGDPFPLIAGQAANVSVPGPGTHTLSITGDFPVGTSVNVQDSLVNIQCQNGSGFGTLNFPGFIINDVAWVVQVNCALCGE